VPVFGVGESDGIRYYAMQYIPARGLDTVIDEVRQLKGGTSPMEGAGGNTASAVLSTETNSPRYYRSVARLGEQVAEALAHAHHQGILHRDIKPANLLLDAGGAAWITDFGLATGEGMEELTNTGDVVGTLRYMAPERLQGQGDARADIYSLGLTLYELLTLRPAFDATDRAELVRQITDANPPLPRKLDPRIPRDLETIVLKACARERSRRYATAGEVADDLRRFLGNRPIEARRTPWWEQAWRWCRRNPAIATTSATALAALFVGLGVSLWQWRRADDSGRQAEANANQAETDFELAFQAVDQMLERVGFVNLEAEPLMDQVRRALLEDAVRFYQNLLRGREGNPRTRFAVARANYRLGQIHGWFKELEEVKRYQDQAFALVGELRAEDPGNLEYRRLEANLYAQRAWLRHSLRQIPDAEADYRRSLEVWESLSAERPDWPLFARGRADAQLRIGDLLYSLARRPEAESAFRQAIAVAEGLPGTEPRRSEILADTHFSLSKVLDDNGNQEESDQKRRLALELYERCARDNPGPRLQHSLAKRLSAMAHVLADDPATRGESEKLYVRSLAISEPLVAAFPDAPHLRHELANASNWYGILLDSLGKWYEAEVKYERAANLWKDLVEKFPETPSHRVGRGSALHHLAMKQAARRDFGKFRAMLEEAIGHQHAVLQVIPDHAIALRLLGFHYHELARILHLTGQTEEAEKLARKQLAMAQAWAAIDRRSIPIRVFLARSYETIGMLNFRGAQLPEGAEARREGTAAMREASGHWRWLAAEAPASAEYASSLGGALNDYARFLLWQGQYLARCLEWLYPLNDHARFVLVQSRPDELNLLVDEAIEAQERAIRARPNEQKYQQYLNNHYQLRAEVRVALGDYASVLPTLAIVRERFPNQMSKFTWASILAQCIPLAEADSGQPPVERTRLAGQYANEAMKLLQPAQQKESKLLSAIHTHPSFAPLRGRPDFQKLLATVPKPSK
jgi:tetratricopeptide (TPR) repeat protein